jgi:RHS repeat-associated protein
VRSVTASGVSTYNHTIYDALGRPAAYNQVTEGQTYLMTDTYNKAGLVVDEMYPSGKVMHNEYDGAGRPAGVKKTTNAFYYVGAAATDATNRIQYSSHGATRVLKLGNSLWEHSNLNSRLQPTQIGLGSSQTSSSVLGLDYTYGVLVGGSLDATKNNSNIQSQTITVPGATFVQSYVYDQVNRLTSVQEKYNAKLIWTQTYGFDRWGNRTSLVNSGSKAQYLPTQSTPPVDSATNRLLEPVYDAAGNMTLADPFHYPFYGYDAENRMSAWRYSTVLAFRYDGDGRRVEKTNQESGDILVFVYNAAGQMVAEYTSFQGAPMPNLKVNYLTADHLSSTRVVTDGTGAVVARHDYLPFGEEIPVSVVRAGIAGYGGADGIRQKFTQKERDSESGLDYFGARYYSSAQGRFTAMDPDLDPDDANDPQRWNRYAYSSSNPLARIDPDGQRWFYTQDDKGSVTDIQWVDANLDGTYTSPGKGWIEFIPTDDKPALQVLTPDRSQVYYFGENADGGPRAHWRWAGGVTDATMGHVVDFLIFKGLGKVLDAVGGAALNAWRAYRAATAVRGAVGLVSKTAAREALERLPVSTAAKEAAKRAIYRATKSSTIDVVSEGDSVVVRISRVGRNGHQVIESVIDAGGKKTVVQRAYDTAGKLVHYDPKK